jgi:hypothetical protein
MVLATATLVMAATLAGCGGSTEGGSSSSAAPSSATQATEASSSAAPEPAVEYATVEQYASVVASTQRDIEDSIVTVDDCALGFSKGDLACALAPMNLALTAGLLKILISEEAKPEDRLLPPPPEIESLVAKTIEAAGVAEDLGNATSDCGLYKGCESEWIELSFAAGDLQDVLDSWAPYL